MECLYCHKKFSSLRFWKSSQFCSKEHAEDYRRQTLDRLLGDGPAEGGDKQPLPLPVVFKAEEEPELAGPPRLKAAAPEAEWRAARIEAPPSTRSAFDIGRSPLITPPPADHASVEEILARAGHQTPEVTEPMSSWQPTSSSLIPAPDVSQQSAEEALEALRSLTRGKKSGGPKPAEDIEDAASLPDWEDAIVAGVGRTAPHAEADDVFAELRRIAATAGDADGEDTSEGIDSAAPIPSFSVLDRLTETPKPRPRDVIPALSRSTKGGQAAVPTTHAPTPNSFNTDTADEIPEPEVVHAAAEQEEEAASCESVTLDAVSPEAAAIDSTGERRREDAGDKVVSFPSQRDLRHRESALQANGSAASGPSFFDPEIHNELVPVDLDNLSSDASALAISVETALDETLRTPAAALSTAAEVADVVTALTCQGFRAQGAKLLELSPAIRPLMYDVDEPLSNADVREPTFPNAGSAGLAFGRAGGFELCAAWRDCLPISVLNGIAGAERAERIVPESEPAAVPFTPMLPLGLLEKMGVTPAGRTRQLVRLQLFHKEPEVREFPFPRSDADASRPDDVRRVYYA